MAMTRGAIQVRGGGPRDGTKAQAQDVPPGYKRTEAGVIPVDWKIATFDRVCTRINGKSYQIYTDAYQVHGALPVVDQGQSHIVGYTDDEGRRFRCPAGGVIVFGDHTCVVKFVDHDFVVGADGTQIIATKPNHCARFHAFALQLRGIPPTGYNRHFKFLKERFFVCPGRPEQRAIAEALSDVDGLLGALEALIAKKRAIKQAAMQQLLTGKTRLPGFSGEWRDRRLADLADFCAGTYLPQVLYKDGAYDVQGAGALMGRHDVANIPRSLSVIGRVGTIGRPRFYPGGCWVNNNAGAVVARPTAEPQFVHLLLLSLDWSSVVSVTAQPFLVVLDLMNTTFVVPDRDEQAAIATVLSHMDAEIAALEARRDKTRQIKQGMMQQLLTGRVRLVKPEAVA